MVKMSDEDTLILLQALSLWHLQVIYGSAQTVEAYTLATGGPVTHRANRDHVLHMAEALSSMLKEPRLYSRFFPVEFTRDKDQRGTLIRVRCKTDYPNPMALADFRGALEKSQERLTEEDIRRFGLDKSFDVDKGRRAISFMSCLRGFAGEGDGVSDSLKSQFNANKGKYPFLSEGFDLDQAREVACMAQQILVRERVAEKLADVRPLTRAMNAHLTRDCFDCGCVLM